MGVLTLGALGTQPFVPQVAALLRGAACVRCGVPSAVIAAAVFFVAIIDFECLLNFVGLGAVNFFIDFLVTVQFDDFFILVDLFDVRVSSHWCFLHFMVVIDDFVGLLAIKVVCLGGHVIPSLILLH